MKISLEEYSKVCGLISSCNDLIRGKFILAYNKIATLLKTLTASKEVYNLLATHLNNFDFEREFSRAQLRSAKEPHKFVLPTEPEKLLPFVFCVLVNINNKNIDLDGFLGEFFTTENNTSSEKFARFANEVILPFRNVIAQTFEIPVDSVDTMVTQPLQNHEKEEEINSRAEELEEIADLEEEQEFETEDEEDFETDDSEELEDDDEKNYPELTEERVANFLQEIKTNCEQILSELDYEKHLKEDNKDDIEYIANTIIYDCENGDLKNTIALITALDYLTQKAKVIKVYTREMKVVLYNFYEGE